MSQNETPTLWWVNSSKPKVEMEQILRQLQVRPPQKPSEFEKKYNKTIAHKCIAVVYSSPCVCCLVGLNFTEHWDNFHRIFFEHPG